MNTEQPQSSQLEIAIHNKQFNFKDLNEKKLFDNTTLIINIAEKSAKL